MILLHTGRDTTKCNLSITQVQAGQRCRNIFQEEDFQEEEALLVVRLHLAQQKAEEALQELASRKGQAQGRLHAVLEMLILQALAHFAARSLPLVQPENCTIGFLYEFTKTVSNHPLLVRIIGPSMNILLNIRGNCAGFRAKKGLVQLRWKTSAVIKNHSMR